MEVEQWAGWVLAGIVSIVGALAAAVTTLWSRSEAKNSLAIEILQAKANQCEKDRIVLHVQCGRLEERIEQLEKQQHGS